MAGDIGQAQASVHQRSLQPQARLRSITEQGMLGQVARANALLTIGEVAQRRYPRWVLRRLAFVAAAQRVGLDLEQVRRALDTLPPARPRPDAAGLDPARGALAAVGGWASCMPSRTISPAASVCGCLSLTRCVLFNIDDEAAVEGEGSRWLRDATRLSDG